MTVFCAFDTGGIEERIHVQNRDLSQIIPQIGLLYRKPGSLSKDIVPIPDKKLVPVKFFEEYHKGDNIITSSGIHWDLTGLKQRC
ncbi:Hypothetical predicted protein [Octopus vulgaris]|uniref:Uncharacterized protein n=1 Tax=Octopus vulgaris TaxID=6645 RepID=A0AA36F9L4_OCTVU|nr:Hypothetical predicted protein [Octopus vulgaris]